MDGAPVSTAPAGAPTAPVATTKPAPSAPVVIPFPWPTTPAAPLLQLTWPRPAQWAAALLLALALVLLAIHARSYLRFGTRPADLQRGTGLAYRIDLNHATRAELLQLPGVGPKTADRLEQYRAVKGGFRSVEELAKVGGIGPKTLERLRGWVCVGPEDEEDVEPPPRPAREPGGMKSGPAASRKPASSKVAALHGVPIDVNRDSVEKLQKLPGIGPKKSQRIVEERTKKPFASVEELRRVPGIGPKTLERLRPYITVSSEAVRVTRSD